MTMSSDRIEGISLVVTVVWPWLWAWLVIINTCSTYCQSVTSSKLITSLSHDLLTICQVLTSDVDGCGGHGLMDNISKRLTRCNHSWNVVIVMGQQCSTIAQ